MRYSLLAACLFFFSLDTSLAQEPQALALETVLSAALRAFPGLLSVEQRQQTAEGEYQTAQGGFDTQLKSQNRWSVTGIYENQNNDVSFEQPTALWGSSFFGGWRRGNGDYPVYEGKSQTAEAGELRLGINVPLWRNREIDRRRASLQQAELGKLIASHDYDQALLDIRRLATQRYWDWVLAGKRLQIAQQLLDIAEQRDIGIKERVKAGDIPEFEALDNQRAILERRERLVASQRLLEQTAIQLSLYWRDTSGQPQLPLQDELPADFPAQEPAVDIEFSQALENALIQRPELKRLQMQKSQTQTELEFQENQQAPGIDLNVVGAQDLGGSTGKINRDELYLGLNIDIPLQRRVAGGRAKTAAANLQRLKWDEQLQQDRIGNEIRDAFSAVTAARQRVKLSALQRQAALQLQQGEQTRFELGDSTLLFVNLREIAHGDAALMAAEAQNHLLKAHADLEAALGTPVKPIEID